MKTRVALIAVSVCLQLCLLARDVHSEQTGTVAGSKEPRTPVLFLMKDVSVESRREAVARLRELGIRVVAQHGKAAVEGMASDGQSEKAMKSGMFIDLDKGPITDRRRLDRLDDGQRRVVSQWNYRFTPEYERARENRRHVGKSWGHKRLEEPLPYSAIDPEEFKQIVRRYEMRTGKTLLEKPKALKPMSPDEFVEYERALALNYDNTTLAYHLARLAYRLGPEWYALISKMPGDLVAAVVTQFFGAKPCVEMTGEVAVGIVFVESSRSGGPRFGDGERAGILQEIQDGLAWLSGEHPDGNLSWVYDLQYPKIDVPNGNFSSCTAACGSVCLEDGWRNPAMALVTYNGRTYGPAWDCVQAYRADLQQANAAQYAIVIFVTPYNNCWTAYSGGGRITLAKNMKDHGNWGNWGQDRLDVITAHETAHFFQATDEYTESGTPCSSCGGAFGCDQIPNGNCEACARPSQKCVMDDNDRRICAYTKAHVGWSDLFIETTTDDEWLAGTDSDVWLDIGDRVFTLDTPGHDDRERGNREGYALRIPNLARSDVKRILIRKGPDDWNGGWKLHRVRAWMQGNLLCDVSGIDRWLEDNHRYWVGCITDWNLASYLKVKISTADTSWAGTDDDVTLTLDGRSWNLDNPWHDDFERGHTDTFDLDPGTGFYSSNIHSVRIHKSPDGVAGGWKLKGVEIIVNGATIYNNQSINKWLEDDDRTWSAGF